MTWIAGLVSAWLVGAAAVAPLWPRDESAGPVLHRVMLATLALGVGFGICSLVEFAVLLAAPTSPELWLVAHFGVVLLAAAGLWLLWRSRKDKTPTEKNIAKPPAAPAANVRNLTWLVNAALAAVVLGAAVALLLAANAFPHGRWDAWAIWNVKAKFLLLGGEQWHDAFVPAMYYSHRDYPLLLPLTVARLWRFAGGPTTIVPTAVGLLWSGMLPLLLYAAVWRWRGSLAAAAAVLGLLCLPWLLNEGAAQMADLPLSFYMLGTAAAVVHGIARPQSPVRLWLLAGLLAGCAAWTKNEGLSFAMAVLLVVAAVAVRRGWRPIALCAAGAAPFLLAVLVHKQMVAAKTDVLESLTMSLLLERLFDWERHWLILRITGQFLTQTWPMTALLVSMVIGAAALGLSDSREQRRAGLAVGVIVALQIAAYWGVYIITPHDLAWHVSESVHRLILQLWAISAFGLLVALKSPAEVLGSDAK